jgi:hypothetical protein
MSSDNSRRTDNKWKKIARWFVSNNRVRRKKEREEEELQLITQQQQQYQTHYAAAAEEAADVAADRLALRSDYGTIVGQAADVAASIKQTRHEKLLAATQVADLVSERTTVRQTAFHLLKGNIGPGCLSLPWSFSQLGVPAGAVMTCFIGGWTYYNCMTLLRVKETHTSNRRTITYSVRTMRDAIRAFSNRDLNFFFCYSIHLTPD